MTEVHFSKTVGSLEITYIHSTENESEDADMVAIQTDGEEVKMAVEEWRGFYNDYIEPLREKAEKVNIPEDCEVRQK